MPDAAGNIKGIALGGKAAEAWERIFGAAWCDGCRPGNCPGPDVVCRHVNLGEPLDPAPEGAGSDQD